ncbi:hypothetical protein NMY22_g3147 [Coprinellus aureogranulatus]|nr:hypothetical protein NMY22_g3147 [Coprinellus aureogranulatus]
MEVFMRNVPWQATRTDLVLLLVEHLHCPEFLLGKSPFNFDVQLPKGKTGEANSGIGFLTFPTAEIGTRFLNFYRRGLELFGRVIQFNPSRSPAGRPRVVDAIRRMPFVHPHVLQEGEERLQELSDNRMVIGTVQFGWDCLDHVFSIESEANFTGTLRYDDERRQFRMDFAHMAHRYHIAIPIPQIEFLAAHPSPNGRSVIFFRLFNPPYLEMDLEDIPSQEIKKSGGDDSPGLRRRISFLPLPHDHERFVAYTSLAVRMISPFPDALEKFQKLCDLSGLRHISNKPYPTEKRNLFSSSALNEFEAFTRSLPWPVAFQVEAIVRKRSASIQEMLEVLPDITELVSTMGQKVTASFLQDLAPKVHALSKHESGSGASVRSCFERSLKDYVTLLSQPQNATETVYENVYRAMHLTLTPTSLLLDGPNREPSNRVIRKYKEYQDSFLRVTFAEEGRFSMQNDRETDSQKYIEDRVGSTLINGVHIAGRKFEFLGYSQSGLKNYTVWFVKPFQLKSGKWVTANAIVADLGDFDNLEFDKTLIRCPARYAARLALAFTTTEAAVTLNNGEQGELDDIKTVDGKYLFTDGVGTMSLAMASDIWKRLRRNRRYRSIQKPPAAYIIRFAGSKGVLSVDHTLRGRKIMLRKSMIKFKAPTSNDIEIVRAVDRPASFFLNRHLIMVLEGLGVPYHIFKKFQDRAVQETYSAPETLTQAGNLLDSHGLGVSFGLPAAMNGLAEIGIRSLSGDRFYDKTLEFTRDHILRNLKHRARIPIPGAWTLVGVADVHKFLQPEEVFACVQPPHGEAFFLEGPVVISRSPVIHPGDVQVARAIGIPPPGSCFDIEPLTNTVVFSVLGERPLPSCLGGGDLDGDIYNIIPLNDPELAGFRPVDTCDPGQYDSAPKKLLPEDKKCTLKDVAQFVMDHLVSDVVGIVATAWLAIADHSELGIFDEDCFRLAEIHSNAVDYPKSGTSIKHDTIPKPKSRAKPDWAAPETVSNPPSARFYQNTGERNAPDPRVGPVQMRVEQFVATKDIDRQAHGHALTLFFSYKAELQTICATKTLSSSRHASLAEEEAFIGTIAQRYTDTGRRKEMLRRLREATDVLVRRIRHTLEGDKGDSQENFLRRSWCAWQVALSKGREFGAQSFGWLALGGIFEAIAGIEGRGGDSGLHTQTSLGKRRAPEVDPTRESIGGDRKGPPTEGWVDENVIDLTGDISEPEVIDLTDEL